MYNGSYGDTWRALRRTTSTTYVAYLREQIQLVMLRLAIKDHLRRENNNFHTLHLPNEFRETAITEAKCMEVNHNLRGLAVHSSLPCHSLQHSLVSYSLRS